jgi:hypothetical protein
VHEALEARRGGEAAFEVGIRGVHGVPSSRH